MRRFYFLPSRSVAAAVMPQSDASSSPASTARESGECMQRFGRLPPRRRAPAHTARPSTPFLPTCSFSFKAVDAMEAHLAATYLRFMMHRCVCASRGCSGFSLRLASSLQLPQSCCQAPRSLHRHPPSAEQLDIVRRVPVPGYDLSFLVTSAHLERYSRDRMVDFICQAGAAAAQVLSSLPCLPTGRLPPGPAVCG